MHAAIITLLTDFGNRDGFVGVMKGVILSILPEARVVDLSHEIAPQDIDAAAFVLSNSHDYFPAGTIHTVVVDPGVGGGRRIICAAACRQLFLAPDNGVLKYLLHKCDAPEVVHVTNHDYFLPQVSSTFHGRDIFAPVAARLAGGLDFRELGEAVQDYQRGALPHFEMDENGIRAEVVYVDRFGNLITNIPASIFEEHRAKSAEITIGGRIIKGLSSTYSDVPRFAPAALLGSSGFLEIGIFMGNAGAELQCAAGDKIKLNFTD